MRACSQRAADDCGSERKCGPVVGERSGSQERATRDANEGLKCVPYAVESRNLVGAELDQEIVFDVQDKEADSALEATVSGFVDQMGSIAFITSPTSTS